MEMLRTENLRKYFSVKAGAFGRSKALKALDGVSISVNKDSVFALVGESGCGKSTFARLAMRLSRPTGGMAYFRERDIFSFGRDELKEFRRAVQIIFQDPFASLNPRMNVLASLSEPLRIHKIAPPKEFPDRVAELLGTVGLEADHMRRYPHEFSGGQRQRICIARAMASSPQLIVADEPLSSLDVSIQAQIINLMNELKERRRLSFIFISHDLNVVHYFADTVAVMYLGRIVEQAETERIFQNPRHPYTEMLLAAIPTIKTADEKAVEDAAAVAGNSAVQPSETGPAELLVGCAFYPRCPKRLTVCKTEVPVLIDLDDRKIACHLHL